MFLQVSVCPQVGRHVWLLAGGMHGCWWGVCMVAGGGAACMVAGRGGMYGCLQGGHAWLLVGGMHGCWQEGMVAGGVHGCWWGGMCGCWWGGCVWLLVGVCAWLLVGVACMVAGRGHARLLVGACMVAGGGHKWVLLGPAQWRKASKFYKNNLLDSFGEATKWQTSKYFGNCILWIPQQESWNSCNKIPF